MLLLYAADMQDMQDELEILLLDALSKEPSQNKVGFKINLETLEEQTCIELFR